MDIQRKEIGPRLSEAVIHQKTIYLAGQVADAGCSPDVYEQTRGERPHPDIELSFEQLSAVVQLVDADAIPYVDFSIFGLHGKGAIKSNG